MARLYEALAQAFRAEDVDTTFVLTGDGNMHWEAAMAALGVRAIHVWHEHCACAMATAYASALDRPGIASVTCGPGLTQTMTALTTAARARIPLVVYAGESPMHARWYNQHVDQAALVNATGARYLPIHSASRAFDLVAEAFHFARTERMPVVLGLPIDLQQQTSPAGDYVPSTLRVADAGALIPDAAQIRRAAARIRAARNIVVLGGRGAKRAGAQSACIALADLCDGILAETLPVRGLFVESWRSVGIAGGFAHEQAREAFAQADLVIAVGASLTHHTIDGGRLFPKADLMQIDADPAGIRHGRPIDAFFVRADARLGVEALVAEVAKDASVRPDWDARLLARQVAELPADSLAYEIEPGLLDPRTVVAELDRLLPRDWEYVNASGHCSAFAAQMRGRSADNFLTIREFGAIGNGLSYAIGVAVAKPDRTVVLTDGDGGLMMHAQELDTIRRYGLRLLICILNDGGYGSEIHQLRQDGLDPQGAIYGRGDLGAMARGHGLNGHTITDLAILPELAAEFQRSTGATLWDFRISDRVVAPLKRRGR